MTEALKSLSGDNEFGFTYDSILIKKVYNSINIIEELNNNLNQTVISSELIDEIDNNFFTLSLTNQTDQKTINSSFELIDILLDKYESLFQNTTNLSTK